MPGMNGADVARAIAADSRLAAIPVVLLTSVDQVDFGKMVIDFGIAAYLTKPARSAILLGTVISVIQKARAQVGKARFVREPAASQATPAAAPAFTIIRGPAIPAPAAPESATAATGPIDILIAEDNDVNQLVFGQILSGLGRAIASPATAAPRSRCTGPCGRS
ncbi:hypothetical protein AJ88_46050 [Mesorhizobium amorphae CCBAU 01583]|nr:hypothetical protein AJ88_46050 [Mesorhizobium amorphae CCBAU 01583]